MPPACVSPRLGATWRLSQAALATANLVESLHGAATAEDSPWPRTMASTHRGCHARLLPPTCLSCRLPYALTVGKHAALPQRKDRGLPSSDKHVKGLQ